MARVSATSRVGALAREDRAGTARGVAGTLRSPGTAAGAAGRAGRSGVRKARGWPTVADAEAAAARFNRLIDRQAGAPPTTALRPYRAQYAASGDRARLAFLLRVDGHLLARLGADHPDAVARAAALLAAWFLRPR